MCCVLHSYAELDVYSGANAQKKTEPQINILLHSDTLFRLPVPSNQSLFSLLNAACLA
jgi:hypothetical protein